MCVARVWMQWDAVRSQLAVGHVAVQSRLEMSLGPHDLKGTETPSWRLGVSVRMPQAAIWAPIQQPMAMMRARML
ncbi:MAG: hypothetical protein V3W44_05205 [Dehalococcoidales bacterium]